MKKAALFDMDGLLLDTEPVWGRVMPAIAARHGIRIPPHRIRETAGLRIIEVCRHWQINFPWPEGMQAENLSEEIVDIVIETSKKDASVLPGVLELLESLSVEGWKIGLASSSSMRMIRALIRHFDIEDYFEIVTSADSCALGKPHPEVYLQCAAALDVLPHECVVLEDTVNGCIAAKAARMKVLAVPHAEWTQDVRFAIADRVVPSLVAADAALISEVLIA